MDNKISDGTYEELECALSINKHFVKEPILLPNCGHCVCKRCLPKETNDPIKCELCKEICEKEKISYDKECIPIKKCLLRNLGNLLKIISEKMKSSIDHISGSDYYMIILLT